ncbi:hypothetical protein [Endozoicomonas arenosclerae]|uniref:hypothetical protein n=1 Tax=Endozoicomonas arenosclerae TaxID=1633495 RepID=UPI000785E1B6|nr:hypothetical protein [Endozoicomonas arenosclerae]
MSKRTIFNGINTAITAPLRNILKLMLTLSARLFSLEERLIAGITLLDNKESLSSDGYSNRLLRTKQP